MPVAAGVGEHADEDLVGVQRPQDGLAAVEQGDQLPARQLGERRNRLEIGVGAVEQVLGQAWAAPNAAGPPATLPAGGGPRGSGSAC